MAFVQSDGLAMILEYLNYKMSIDAGRNRERESK